MNVFGIGTDIVECLRIAQMIERHGELFIDRVYTTAEIEYCRSRKQATQHFAGRWAAKEAIMKAIGTGWRRGISWRDMEVRNNEGGKPTVALRGDAGRRRAVRHRGCSGFDFALPLARHGVRDCNWKRRTRGNG